MRAPQACLVTGASARLGLAIATRLADAGYAVALHASPRSREAAETEAARFAERGVRSAVVVADLADPDACESLIDRGAAAVGSLGLLVNNASVFETDSVATLDLERWDRHFAVNLRAPVILARAFAAQVPPGADASVVNMIDQKVLRPTPQHFTYTLAKSALWTATRTMAQAFAEQGVRVNAIGPGPVLPNAHEGDTGFQREVAGIPLQRDIDPADIADAVLYLAGARGVTGQIIAVDAGQHLGWRTPDVAT